MVLAFVCVSGQVETHLLHRLVQRGPGLGVGDRYGYERTHDEAFRRAGLALVDSFDRRIRRRVGEPSLCM